MDVEERQKIKIKKKTGKAWGQCLWDSYLSTTLPPTSSFECSVHLLKYGINTVVDHRMWQTQCPRCRSTKHFHKHSVPMLCSSSTSSLCPWSALKKNDHVTSMQCCLAWAMDSPTSLENELPWFIYFGEHLPLHPADFTCVQNFDTNNVLLWSPIKLPLPVFVEQFARQNKPD